MANNIVPATSRRRQTGLRTAVLALVVAASSAVGIHAASAAPDFCNGVFSGATPRDPITKVADTASVVPGGEVTYTIQWHSTGVATADVTDCFRVDDGSNAVLNALVTGLNISVDVANVGPAGSAQSYVYTVTIPNNASLIGRTVVNRVKITNGSVESRSALVSVNVIAPPDGEDPVEICGDGIDNDDDGLIDEDCPGGEDPVEICGDGIDNDDDGLIDEDCPIDPEDPVDPEVPGDNGGSTVGGTRTERDGGSKVLGTRKALPKNLAKTGAETTAIAWIGSLMLLLGIGLRFGRYTPVRVAFAGRGTAVAPSLSAFGLVSVAQQIRLFGALLSTRARTSRY